MGRLERHLDDEAIARAERSIADRECGIIHHPEPKERRQHNPRGASTYRGARRNEALRDTIKTAWGPDWYYGDGAQEARKHQQSRGRLNRSNKLDGLWGKYDGRAIRSAVI